MRIPSGPWCMHWSYLGSTIAMLCGDPLEANLEIAADPQCGCHTCGRCEQVWAHLSSTGSSALVTCCIPAQIQGRYEICLSSCSLWKCCAAFCKNLYKLPGCSLCGLVNNRKISWRHHKHPIIPQPEETKSGSTDPGLLNILEGNWVLNST